MIISVLAAAVAPGAALLAYFYLKDRYAPEPISMVIRMFLAGALVVFPVMVLQRAVVLAFGENPFLFSFVYSAGVEEFFKWFLLYFLIYKHVEFDEPYDGIVYAVAVSLGFATVENVIYSLLDYKSFSQLLFRAFLPVSGHALFGVVMGFYMGKAKFHTGRPLGLLAVSLAFPVFYHGLYDYILIELKRYWIWLIVPLMVFLWARSLWKVNHANSRSPLRAVYSEDEVKLPT
ncbi:glutamic-type intramembrane protease PrsW [Paenibacillus aurantius]|uniref:Protease PrsW n=1 Tax=Paenibacillus aurantius TaxID=2918900 RepID=A0AA96RDD8_9BACL|nr:glutamic-type intramembrane protease PrsW [Paenibacillus aurantius]WNQ09311.1 glutamic-type intramembrane protease PrsW [Paenibacillus aurantius]